MQPQTVYVNTSNSGPGCLVRWLYFFIIGIPLGLVWTIIAWVLMVTVIGLPLGLWMVNRIPQVMTLKEPRTTTRVTVVNGVAVVQHNVDQAPFLLRAIYFLLVGWWLSLVWMILAWVFTTLTLGFGIPLAFWMFDRVPALTTLSRN
jgi:uncharacterized membrane protein YccF (DUF307 family)